MKKVKFDYKKAKALEKQHPGKHIKTKNGFNVKILSWNIGGEFPICAVIKNQAYQYDVAGNIEIKSYRDAFNLILEIPEEKQKISKFHALTIQREHSFYWKPITEIAEELDEPVIFLTDKGRMITHSSLRGDIVDGKTINLFSYYMHNANAVAWVYQKDLFNVDDFIK